VLSMKSSHVLVLALALTMAEGMLARLLAEEAAPLPPAGGGVTSTAADQAAVTEEEKPWPSEFFRSLVFSGYLETSYTYNFQSPDPPAGVENVGRIFDIWDNEFMLNAFMLNVERPVDEEHWVGFKVTPFIGEDAEITQAYGLFKTNETVETPIDTDGDGQFDAIEESEVTVSDGNFDLLNAYISGYVPQTRTTIKLGKMETTVGAEVIQAPYNDNFSRSYLFGFAIPYTHTGIMAFQPVLTRAAGTVDMLTLGLGISNGWDNVKDLNDAKLFHFMASFAPCDEFSVAGNLLYSTSEQADDSSHARTLFDLVATVKPIPTFQDLKFLLNFDWAGEQGAAVNGGYAHWYGFSGITKLDFSLSRESAKDWYVAMRGEFFNDADGARTSGLVPNDGLFLYELTFTLGYRPTTFLLLRTEVRYDKADQDVFYHDGGSAAGEPNENHQTTLAFDASFLF